MGSESSSATGGFVVQELFAAGYMAKVFRIACPAMHALDSLDAQALGAELGALIAQTDRMGGPDTTIVLEVVGGTIVPLYVDFAIEYLIDQRAQIGVIVVCEGVTTHDPDSTLPKALCANVSEVNRRGLLWNPVSKRVIPARGSAAFGMTGPGAANG